MGPGRRYQARQAISGKRPKQTTGLVVVEQVQARPSISLWIPGLVGLAWTASFITHQTD